MTDAPGWVVTNGVNWGYVAKLHSGEGEAVVSTYRDRQYKGLIRTDVEDVAAGLFCLSAEDGVLTFIPMDEIISIEVTPMSDT